MSPELPQIEAQALSLPSEDREILAGVLLHSLEQAPTTEIDEAWIAEAERRYEEWRAGRSAAVPGDQFFPDVRRDLGWR